LSIELGEEGVGGAKASLEPPVSSGRFKLNG
jgi:hypothetical protein